MVLRAPVSLWPSVCVAGVEVESSQATWMPYIERICMINYACRYFRASKPCVFNKSNGSECSSCDHVSEYRERVLFIKLDAIGDVLRSASLLPIIIARHDAPYIAWLTRSQSAELVAMMHHVDEVIELSPEGLVRVTTGAWDHVYSLSNDLPSASLATAAASKTTPVGYYVTNGGLRPSNEAASHWLEMAAFDRVKRANKRSYQQLMLAIIGAADEPVPAPELRVAPTLQTAVAARVSQLFSGRPRQRVAVNVGSGGRWPKKMLTAEQIYRYSQLLRDRADVDVLLVGGSSEVDKAAAILTMRRPDDRIEAALTESSIAQFVATLREVDALLCGDTLALHIATAVGLPTVAVFGPTSPSEIFDFGGLVAKVWTRELDCLVCYGDCNKEANCMSTLDLAALADLTVQQLRRARSTHVGR